MLMSVLTLLPLPCSLSQALLLRLAHALEHSAAGNAKLQVKNLHIYKRIPAVDS